MDSLAWPFNFWQNVLETAHGDITKWVGEIPEPSGQTLYLPAFEEIFSSVLDERRQKVVRLRFEAHMTYEAVGNEIGVSKERVHQMIVDSRRVFRKPENFWKLYAVPQTQVFRLKDQLREMTNSKNDLEYRVESLLFQIERMKEAEKQEREKNNLPVNATIAELGLTIRSYHALNSQGIVTVGDLISYTEREVRGFKNIGKSSVFDIKKALIAHGHQLREEKML